AGRLAGEQPGRDGLAAAGAGVHDLHVHAALALDRRGGEAPFVSIAPVRQEAFLQSKPGTPVDRFGVWLSGLQIRRFVPTFAGKRIGDFGCGYQAAFTRTVLDQAERAVLVDVALADDLKAHPRVQAIEGVLP